MQKVLLLILLFYCYNISFAVVPTTDVYQVTEDNKAIASYFATMNQFLQKIGDTMTVVDQIKNLHSIEDASRAVASACRLCKPIERQQLNSYIKNINSDLCSQFQYAIQNITGISKTINNLGDIINLLQTNPKEAVLALQRASIQAEETTENTLVEIQFLLSQQEQKHIAEDTLEQENTKETYAGFEHAGL